MDIRSIKRQKPRNTKIYRYCKGGEWVIVVSNLRKYKINKPRYVVEGIEYSHIADIMDDYGISEYKVRGYLQSEEWPEWRFLTKDK